MTLRSRVKKLEMLELHLSRPIRSPVTWAAIVDGQLIRLGLMNGTNLTGPEAWQALDEAKRMRDPYKVYLFDPKLLDA
jgi:hypothetical protein